MRRPAALIVLLLVVGCNDDRSSARTTETPATSVVVPVSTTEASHASALVPMQSPLFPDRPFDVFVPSAYDDATPTPLVISLHGFTGSGAQQEQYIKLQPEAEARGFLYIHPDGITSEQGYEGWNATEACCSGDRSIDDAGYLTSMIDEVTAAFNVDPARIYFIGYSNGGFMSYRMACDHADRIAAIVSLAGAMFLDPTDCAPSEPVSVLEIHGDHDETIEFDGGTTLFGEYPAAGTTLTDWATFNHCGTDSHTLEQIHIDAGQLGQETTPIEYLDCPTDGAAELWIIEGGTHSPALAETFVTNILDWLFAHPKAK